MEDTIFILPCRECGILTLPFQRVWYTYITPPESVLPYITPPDSLVYLHYRSRECVTLHYTSRQFGILTLPLQIVLYPYITPPANVVFLHYPSRQCGIFTFPSSVCVLYLYSIK
jgi:hypothetical protein